MISVLEAFESAPGSLSLAEISVRSGTPISTTHRLVAELASFGVLERTSSGRYQVGIRLWELAQKAGRQLREAARPRVQDLAAITNQSVLISVRQGRDSLLIERAHGDRQAARMSKVGSRLPLHASAAGKVLLAFEAEWIKRAYLAEPLQRLTRETHVDRELLERELTLAAQDGYAQSLEEVRAGASAIAVPVFHLGHIAASLSIVTEAFRVSQLKKYLPALRATAAVIEETTRHLPRDALLGAGNDSPPSAAE
ncbi:MAG TPA: IclR family transcriptional regulator [Microbacterium sp.]|uniref:IclR family transcriptional regulator n=1 Tax=Microbacterium sp. TaxID=51671 RepID=UPI002BDFE91D|nr:IclR family transcriptional regulator [Microbacterium sp.]HWI32408.1 IclR family transcriptional regulator [Microbacterium sp.]